MIDDTPAEYMTHREKVGSSPDPAEELLPRVSVAEEAERGLTEEASEGALLLRLVASVRSF